MADEITISVNPKIYTLDCIYSAAYILMEKAYFILDGDPEKEVIVKIIPKDAEQIGQQSGLKADDIEKLFFEEMLNYKHYHMNLEKNKEITRLIIEKALFTANPAIIEDAKQIEIKEIVEEIKKESRLEGHSGSEEMNEKIKQIKQDDKA